MSATATPMWSMRPNTGRESSRGLRREGHAVAPAALDGVQRGVRALEQAGVALVRAGDRAADRDACIQAHTRGRADRRATRCGLDAAGDLEQDGELVAPDPERLRAGREQGASAGRPVSRSWASPKRMPARVVERLEAVEVAEHHRRAAPLVQRARTGAAPCGRSRGGPSPVSASVAAAAAARPPPRRSRSAARRVCGEELEQLDLLGRQRARRARRRARGSRAARPDASSGSTTSVRAPGVAQPLVAGEPEARGVADRVGGGAVVDPLAHDREGVGVEVGEDRGERARRRADVQRAAGRRAARASPTRARRPRTPRRRSPPRCRRSRSAPRGAPRGARAAAPARPRRPCRARGCGARAGARTPRTCSTSSADSANGDSTFRTPTECPRSSSGRQTSARTSPIAAGRRRGRDVDDDGLLPALEGAADHPGGRRHPVVDLPVAAHGLAAQPAFTHEVDAGHQPARRPGGRRSPPRPPSPWWPPRRR